MGLSYRDLATAWVDGAGLKSKTAANQVSFFNHLIAPGEKYKYFWTDGASEFEGAVKQLGAAWDDTQQGNKKHNARAERANSHILDGIRCLLLQSGLPMPWWPFRLAEATKRISWIHRDCVLDSPMVSITLCTL